jgi:ribosomal protein S27AE
MLVPADFGRHGHYRAAALDEAAALPAVYAGQAVCNDCHDDVVATKAEGYHATAACEGCHGACLSHTEYPDSITPTAPRDRGYCVLCHEYLESRPTGFPQIVSASHHPLKPCIECHDPHNPAPPEAPKECTACHAAIGRTKAASEHVYLECTRCHRVPEEHRIRPREVRASKPATRAVCGECHGEDSAADPNAPRIDMASHGGRYVCWQCHYPHNPEAK